MYSDNPERDFERYDREQQEILAKLPKCEVCGEHIQDDHCYDFYGDIVCPDCVTDYCNRNYREVINI